MRRVTSALVRLYRRRIGRRGAFLLTLCVLQALIGWSIARAPRGTFHLLHVLQHIPEGVLVAGWQCGAMGSLVGAFSRYGRMERLGFILSYLVPFLWGFIYLISWFYYHDLSAEMGIRSAAVYWCYSSLVILVSGWPDTLEPMEG